MLNEVMNGKGQRSLMWVSLQGCGLFGAGVTKISLRAWAHILWGTGSA